VHTDEGFREIQLNGKQLVFLFMAATVVSVVIFLCGVLVGRGVRPDRPAAAETTPAAVVPDPVATPPPQAAATPAQPPVEPPAPAEELTYYDRLQKNDTPKEILKPSSPAVNATVQPAQKVPFPAAPARQTAAAETHSAPSSGGEPSGPGFALQVTTQRDRQSADIVMKQLLKKGYPAYVLGPVTVGGRSIFRIRVGKYKTAKEADAVSKRLETEEQFGKPWRVQ
jgi:septal ring-binding cell division protein DamX